jgi:hypothetical protein
MAVQGNLKSLLEAASNRSTSAKKPIKSVMSKDDVDKENDQK